MPGERRNSSAGSDDSSRGTLENQRTRPAPVIDDNPQARNEWFLRSRSDADGQVLRGVYLEASRKRHRIQHGAPEAGTPGPPGTVNWTPLGPSVVSGGFVESGRVTTVTVGPSGTRVYAGAANGGVWLSGDGGATWSPIDDYVVSPSLTGGAAQADSLAIGALAVSFGPSAAGDELYVGTGDPNASYDAYLGIGIRHLTGGSWSLEATNLVNCGIFDIVIDPDDATMVLAATTKGLYRRPTSGSMDTWSLVTSPAFTNGSGAASALIVAGSGTGKTYYLAFESDNVLLKSRRDQLDSPVRIVGIWPNRAGGRRERSFVGLRAQAGCDPEPAEWRRLHGCARAPDCGALPGKPGLVRHDHRSRSGGW